MKDMQFNLQSLLRLEDLGLRNLAKRNQTLRIEEYYQKLSAFLKNRHLATDTLNRIIENNATSNEHWSLKNLKTQLEDIGCRKYSTIIKDIVKASEIGHHKFASENANKLLEKINGLAAKIASAEKIKAEDDEIDDSGDKDDKTQSLSAFLFQLELDEVNRKMRILAIDDATVTLNTISSVLSEEYKVYGMTDPKMLEKFLQKITPELFLLDYQMPEINGFELVPIIRSFEEHKNTPIIFLTSFGTIEHVSSAFALGACDFIVKPFQGDILREKVAKHIVRKNLL